MGRQSRSLLRIPKGLIWHLVTIISELSWRTCIVGLYWSQISVNKVTCKMSSKDHLLLLVMEMAYQQDNIFVVSRKSICIQFWGKWFCTQFGNGLSYSQIPKSHSRSPLVEGGWFCTSGGNFGKIEFHLPEVLFDCKTNARMQQMLFRSNPVFIWNQNLIGKQKKLPSQAL